MKKRVLITGAAGFLGSHLCDRFIKDGFIVFGMDNLITGKLQNLEHLNNNKCFEFINHDVSEYISLKENWITYFILLHQPVQLII